MPKFIRLFQQWKDDFCVLLGFISCQKTEEKNAISFSPQMLITSLSSTYFRCLRVTQGFYCWHIYLHLTFISWTPPISFALQRHEKLDGKVDYFHPTKYWEAGEEAHGAPDQTKLGLKSQLPVPLDLVEGGRHKVELDQVQRSWLFRGSWNKANL